MKTLVKIRFSIAHLLKASQVWFSSLLRYWDAVIWTILVVLCSHYTALVICADTSVVSKHVIIHGLVQHFLSASYMPNRMWEYTNQWGVWSPGTKNLAHGDNHKHGRLYVGLCHTVNIVSWRPWAPLGGFTPRRHQRGQLVEQWHSLGLWIACLISG